MDDAGRQADEAFIERVVSEVATRFPEQAGELGAQGTRQAVADAVARGRGHGLESEHDLFLFTVLAFAFGARFDEDPALGWAGQTLRSRLLGTPSERIERTYELALAATGQSGRPWVPLPSGHTAAGRA